MTIQVKELIDKIKNEGVLVAESTAQAIIAEAERTAAQIITDSKAKAESYKLHAEEEIKKQSVASSDALKQAARDILIGLEKQILRQFEAVIYESVDEALTVDLTQNLIVELSNAWVAKGEEGIKIVLSSKEGKDLETGLRAKLSQRFKNGVEIIPSAKVTKGFRIGGSDGALYNFSTEGISEVLVEIFSTTLAATLREII